MSKKYQASRGFSKFFVGMCSIGGSCFALYLITFLNKNEISELAIVGAFFLGIGLVGLFITMAAAGKSRDHPDITAGMMEKEVKKMLGEPDQTMKISEKKIRYKYKWEEISILFENGKVVDVNFLAQKEF